MSEDDKAPLFPENWCWERYEEGATELTRRLAAMAEIPLAYERLHHVSRYTEINSYEALKFESWFKSATEKGALPSEEAFSELSGAQQTQAEAILVRETAVQRLRLKSLALIGSTPERANFNPPTGDLMPRNDDPGLSERDHTFPVRRGGPDRDNSGGRSRE